MKELTWGFDGVASRTLLCCLFSLCGHTCNIFPSFSSWHLELDGLSIRTNDRRKNRKGKLKKSQARQRRSGENEKDESGESKLEKWEWVLRKNNGKKNYWCASVLAWQCGVGTWLAVKLRLHATFMVWFQPSQPRHVRPRLDDLALKLSRFVYTNVVLVDLSTRTLCSESRCYKHWNPSRFVYTNDVLVDSSTQTLCWECPTLTHLTALKP